MIRKYLPPLFAALAGLGGAFLRKRELEAVFDEGGLAISGAPETVLTATCVIAELAIIAVFAVAYCSKRSAPEGLSALRPDYLGLILMIAGGVAMVFGAAKEFNGGGLTTAGKIYTVLAAASGLGAVYIAATTRLGKGGELTPVFAAAMIFAFALRMATEYRANAGNPALVEYAYTCAAFASATVAAYYIAGFAFDRPALRGAVGASLCAVVLLITAAGEVSQLAQKLIIYGAAAYFAACAAALIGGAEKG